MSLSPVANIAPNYRDYKNWWLKFYEAGTTIPKEAALNSTGSPTVSKLQINKDGFITSAGGAIVFPYVVNFYDAYLFPTEAEADANNTVNAVRVADGNIVAANTSGSGLVITSFTELVTLTAGQTTVNFSEISTIQTAIYVSGPLVDDGRLLPTRDYNVVNDTQLILTSSYPAGTAILGVQNESAESEDLDITVVDNVATAMVNSPLTSGKMALSKRYYAGGDVVQGLLYEIVPGGTGTANGGTLIDLLNGNQARLIYGESINVKQFGAVGDGVVNDTAAIQAAVNAVLLAPTELYFEEGEYKLSANISVNMSGLADALHIRGAGSGLAKLVWDSGITTGISITTASANRNVIIEGLTLETTLSGVGDALKITHEIGGFAGPIIRDIEIVGSGYFVYGIHLVRAGKAKIDQCWIRPTSQVINGTSGIFLDDNSTDVRISNTDVFFYSNGVEVVDFSEGVNITSCTFIANNTGVRINNNNGPLCLISNNHISSFNNGVVINNCAACHINNLDIIKRSESTASFNGVLISGNSSFSVINNNTIRGGGVSGTDKCISVVGGDLHSISNNLVRLYDTAIDVSGSTNATVVDNVGDGSGVLYSRGVASTARAYRNTPYDADPVLPDGNTTPSVGGYNSQYFLTGNTTPTSIITFTSDRLGDIIYLQANDGNTTLVHSAGLLLQGNVNYAMNSGDVITLRRASTGWREMSRRA